MAMPLPFRLSHMGSCPLIEAGLQVQPGRPGSSQVSVVVASSRRKKDSDREREREREKDRKRQRDKGRRGRESIMWGSMLTAGLDEST